MPSPHRHMGLVLALYTDVTPSKGLSMSGCDRYGIRIEKDQEETKLSGCVMFQVNRMTFDCDISHIFPDMQAHSYP
jgi:hypothetical protein